jgi:hypothetical protein
VPDKALTGGYADADRQAGLGYLGDKDTRTLCVPGMEAGIGCVFNRKANHFAYGPHRLLTVADQILSIWLLLEALPRQRTKLR